MKPKLYDHGHTYGEFKMFTTLLWAAEALGAATRVVETRRDAAAVPRPPGAAVVVVSDQYPRPRRNLPSRTTRLHGTPTS